MLETLIRLLRERGFDRDSEVLLKLLDQEIARVIAAVERMLDVLDADTCPEELLDYLGANLGVPFLPSAPYAEKLEYFQRAILSTVPADKFPRLAEILRVNLAQYPSLEEQRLALWEASRTASEAQLNECLYVIGAAYLLGVMTPDQKRLAIKQALSWYKVRGTEHSYQILLRVFGLSANIIPLWTETYQDFWSEPQGPTVFEGGTWYPTPHYAIEFRRWSDEGTVSASVINLYTKLVQEEVQPIQCVLTRVSFVQELVDFIEFSDEVTFEIPIGYIDLVSWPFCSWQDRGAAFLPEIQRDKVRAIRDGQTFFEPLGAQLIQGIGRGVREWNETVASWWQPKYRDGSFWEGSIVVSALFLRDDPRGPNPWLTLQRNGRFSRDAFLLAFNGNVSQEVKINQGSFWGDSGLIDPTLFLPLRSEELCLDGVDYATYEGRASFVEEHSYPFTRDSVNPVFRSGEHIEGNRENAWLDYLALETFELDLIPLEGLDYVDPPTLEAEDSGLLETNEVFSDRLYFRDGTCEYTREGVLFRAYQPERTTDYLRDGSVAWDRGHGFGLLVRDGSVTKDRESYALHLEEFTFVREELVYLDEFSYDIIPTLVDTIEFLDETELEVTEIPQADAYDFYSWTSDEVLPVFDLAEHFCGYYRLDRGPRAVYQRTQVTEWLRDGSIELTRADARLPSNRLPYYVYQEEEVFYRSACYRDPVQELRAGASFSRDGSVSRNLRELLPARDGSFDRTVCHFTLNIPLRDGSFGICYLELAETEVVWEDLAETFWEGAFEASASLESEDVAGFSASDEPNLLGPEVTVNPEDKFCYWLRRDDWPGARERGFVLRSVGYPDREWGALRSTAEFLPREGIAVYGDRVVVPFARDGEQVTRVANPAFRGDSYAWPTRDVVIFGDLYRRRDGTCFINELLEISSDPIELTEDVFCYTTLTRETASDFLRDGSACWSRDGTNCCAPGDALEIIEGTLCPNTWDAPLMTWDMEYCTWDT